MISELFINGCILIAAISLGNQIFKETGFRLAESFKSKLLKGVLASFIGVILMIYSINFDNLLVLDLRAIATFLSAIYGGVISSVITGLILAFFRLFMFGISKSSIVGSINAVVTAVAIGLIAEHTASRIKKWILMTIVVAIVNIINFIIMLPNHLSALEISLVFTTAIFSISIVLYYYTNYLESYNILFNKLKQEVNIDFLTGLYNVRQFDKILNTTVNEIAATNSDLSLLFIDIDYFKKINDTYGHIEGDEVLRQLAEILLTNCRHNDMVFRYGGEEFAVILQNCSSSEAVEIAERIRHSIESKNFNLTNHKKIKITVSVGVASYPENVKDINALKEKADIALYQSKHKGRNTVSSF